MEASNEGIELKQFKDVQMEEKMTSKEQLYYVVHEKEEL